MHALTEPLFQPACIIVQFLRPGEAAELEAEPPGQSANEAGVVCRTAMKGRGGQGKASEWKTAKVTAFTRWELSKNLVSIVTATTLNLFMRLRHLFPALLVLFTMQASAQKNTTPKFGKLTPADFEPVAYPIDSSADAIVLSDIGSSRFHGNTEGGVSLEHRVFRRARILKKPGYDIAEVTIPLYTAGSSTEELEKLRATTYNLDNKQVVETKLDVKSGVFKEKRNKNFIYKTFTLPNLREGSIIEYEYTIKSNFYFNLQPWDFQSEYPHLHSEYTVAMPEFFYYVTMFQGYHRFHAQETKNRVENFAISSSGTTADSRTSDVFSAGITDHRWVMKDVPALRQEKYTSTLNNHISRISFQLSETRAPFALHTWMGTWAKASEDLLKSEHFGQMLKNDPAWVEDLVKDAVTGAKSDDERIRRIYEAVRNTMVCTNNTGIYVDRPLKQVLKSRNGTVAEINMLLVVALRKAGFTAHPMLLSTRQHGYVYPVYPLMDRFNYVVVQVGSESPYRYLDASRSRLGFGKLEEGCYNGHARVMDVAASPVEMPSETIAENKVTSVFLGANAAGEISGSFQQVPGYYESYHLRDRIAEKGRDDVFNEFQRGFGHEVSLTEPMIDSLQKLDEPLGLRFNFSWKPEQADVIYLNPVMLTAMQENPFKSANRFYPVELPYKMDETYMMRMDVPAGFEVDEIPKQLRMKLNEEGDGSFDYLIEHKNGTVQMRTRLQLKRCTYEPEEYEMLRQFFAMVVEKQQEQIVLKRKSKDAAKN